MSFPKIKTLIIDDEPAARNLIVRLLKNISDIVITGQCGTGKEAIKAIDRWNPDLIFLDIKLKDMTGFDVLENVKTIPALVVFVTAFDAYAIKAFDVFAFDYLLKPFREERFYRSVHKAITTFRQGTKEEFHQKIDAFLTDRKSMTEQADTNPRISVRLGNKTLFVSVASIQYITASNYYAEIFTEKAKYVLRNSMHNLMKIVGSVNFIRIHRSTIINIHYISELINGDHGVILIKMKDQKEFRISKTYKKAFLMKMGI